MRRLLAGIVLACLPVQAGRAQAPSQVQPPAQDQEASPARTPPPDTPQPAQPQAGLPVFVIYPANPPSRATILLNTVTGETWLLGVNGPGGQYQWTRIAVGDPSETAAPPR